METTDSTKSKRRIQFSLLTLLLGAILTAAFIHLNFTPRMEKVFYGVYPPEFNLHWWRGFPFVWDEWTDRHTIPANLNSKATLNLVLCSLIAFVICAGFEWATRRRKLKLAVLCCAPVLAIGVFAARLKIADSYPQELPAQWSGDVLLDSIQIWRLGPRYLQDTAHVAFPDEREKTDDEFRVNSIKYLITDRPYLKNAVQFSCAISVRQCESGLEGILESNSEKRILALACLLRVKAPASVENQWKALNELRKTSKTKTLLDDMATEFELPTVQAFLCIQPPEKEFDSETALEWAIRAAGVTNKRELLPKIRELSVNPNLHTNLAAELSLEDFTGPEADEALAYCVRGWRYNGFLHAGKALQKRNKDLLLKTLLENEAPERHAYLRANMLADCDHPSAVPILCREVSHVNIIDMKMFAAIDRLAQPEHWPLIAALPDNVRDNQRESALRVRERVGKRLGKIVAK